MRQSIAIWVFFFSFLSACSESLSELKGAVVDLSSLETELVEQQVVAKELAFDGVVEAVNQAVVSAQTSGRVTELPFDVGDYVAKGDVVARFTSQEQRAALKSAEAGLQEANARLAEAEQQFTRIQDVYKKGLVAKANFDQTEAQLKSARARVEAANAAAIDAKERLKYTTIIAPYSGIVVKRLTDIGAAVSPGTPIMEGLSLEDLRVRVSIPQQHIGPLRKHKRARVLLGSGESLQVEQLRIPPKADSSSHSFSVLLDLPQGEYGLFPGTLSKVVFVIGEEVKTLVPQKAVAYRGELAAVYIIKNSRLEFRYVRLGTPTDKGLVPVLSGLNPGEVICVNPLRAVVFYKQQFSAQGLL